MGLRDLIEAKQRRTATWPLLVGNPSAAAAQVDRTRQALTVHLATVSKKDKPTKADATREKKLRDELKVAVEGLAGITVNVELQSLPDAEWEAMFGSVEPDANGDLDLDPILAPLLAASCTDPELQDVDWWTEQLAKPTWSDGDKAAASATLLELNAYAPRFDALGKG